MSILDELRKLLVTPQDGIFNLNSLPKEYPALRIRTNGMYGVAIPCESNITISEEFANCKIYASTLMFAGEKKHYLILGSYNNDVRYEFATLCAEFVDPGENGIAREKLLTDPLAWWKHWKELMGNAIKDAKVYDVIAELQVLDYLYMQDKSVVWAAITSGSHDIEGDNGSYEVKSTIKKYDSTITISGQHQLKSEKGLELFFCKMEKSQQGISINDMVEALVSHGYDKDLLEQQLNLLRYENGKSARNDKYFVLERRKYLVDGNFPKITDESFKDDKMPQGVTKITYTVNLDGLPYTVW